MTDDRHRIAAEMIARALGRRPDDAGTERLAEDLARVARIDRLERLLFAAALELDPEADGDMRRAAALEAGVYGAQPTRQLLDRIYAALRER